MKAIVPIQKIMNVVCDYFEIEEKHIKGKSRRQDIKNARQIYFYICSQFTELKSSKISETANREHSTYLYSCSKIKIEMSIYPILKTDIDQIIVKLFECNSLIPDDINLLKLSENYTNSFL